MKTIYLGCYDMNMFVDRKEKTRYKISFSCPYCNKKYCNIKEESKGKFTHECDGCGQIFVVDYDNL